MGDLEEASREDLIAQIKSLRQENANRRTQLREFEAVFDQFDEPTSKGLLALVGKLATDEQEAAVVLRDLAHDILGEKILDGAPWVAKEDEPKEDEPEEEEVSDELMAKIEALEAQIAEMTAGKDAEAEAREAEEAAQLEEIIQEAEALGYKRGTPEIAHLFFTASRGDGDLAKAHEKVGPLVGIEVKKAEGEGEEGVEEGEEGEEDEDGKRFPSTAKANAGTPGMAKNEAPTDFAGAEAAVRAMLDSIPD